MMEPETRAPEPDVTDSRNGEQKLPSWRWEALRTTLWLVPTVLVVASSVLFVVTLEIDWAAFHHHLSLPSWMTGGSVASGQQVLIAIAAAVITVVGVVFSITIVALTLASQQFGPRMMRNFVRDVGNQVTLGVFVATFVYSILTLVATTSDSSAGFVPHLSITTAEVLVLVDLAVLIYFIHHVAKSIQLPEVIAGIARDLLRAINTEYPEPLSAVRDLRSAVGKPLQEVVKLLNERGVVVASNTSGYLQFVGYLQLIDIASKTDSVIRLEHRPGHFVVAGSPLATVWPGGAAQQVASAMDKAHVTGPHRTLMQDPVFAIDQLVEIAIRALSPAVNDTFTALTCIDWLSAGLALVSTRRLLEGVYLDREGRIRLIESDPSYQRMVDRAFDKVRQSAGGMPAVILRLIDSLSTIANAVVSPAQRRVLARQGEAIMRMATDTVHEPKDLKDIEESYARLERRLSRADSSSSEVVQGIPGSST